MKVHTGYYNSKEKRRIYKRTEMFPLTQNASRLSFPVNTLKSYPLPTFCEANLSMTELGQCFDSDRN